MERSTISHVVATHGLDFCDEKVAFLEIGAHLEFVGGGAAAEDTEGEVDAGEGKAC